jgi:hypothetical protein
MAPRQTEDGKPARTRAGSPQPIIELTARFVKAASTRNLAHSIANKDLKSIETAMPNALVALDGIYCVFGQAMIAVLH